MSTTPPIPPDSASSVPPPVPPSPDMPRALASSDDKLWATLVHLAQLLNFLTGFGGIIAVAVIWAVYREKSAHVEGHAREALNFQITSLIFGVVSAVLCFILIGFIGLFLLFLANLIFPIIAAMQANEGRFFRYPVTLRLVPAP